MTFEQVKVGHTYVTESTIWATPRRQALTVIGFLELRYGRHVRVTDGTRTYLVHPSALSHELESK